MKYVKRKKIDYAFMVILFLLPFIHVRHGVDLTDTAYSLGNYENLPNMNLTWSIATFWANILGRSMTMLPKGHTWLGMSIYTTLLIVVFVEVTYLFLCQYMPRGIVFIGEILALSLCWCPYAVLYNYLTYMAFAIAIMILINALERENRLLMGLAGGVLATNVFVRIPNIVEVVLILVVWLWGWLKRKSWSGVVRDTFACIAGFFAGLLINYGIVTVLYGINAIPMMIQSLFTISNSNYGYSLSGMVAAICGMYKETMKSVFFMVSITAVLLIIYQFCKRTWTKLLFACVEMILISICLYLEYRNGTYNFDFYSEYSFIYFATVFLEIAIVISMITFFVSDALMEKIFAIIVLIIVAVTPIGSNTRLYPIFNNLFLVAPMTIWMLWNRLFKGKEINQLLGDKEKINFFPVRLMVTFLMTIIMIQSVCFGFFFVYCDVGFPFNSAVEIKENNVLKGMRTNAYRVDQIYGNVLCVITFMARSWIVYI